MSKSRRIQLHLDSTDDFIMSTIMQFHLYLYSANDTPINIERCIAKLANTGSINIPFPKPITGKKHNKNQKDKTFLHHAVCANTKNAPIIVRLLLQYGATFVLKDGYLILNKNKIDIVRTCDILTTYAFFRNNISDIICLYDGSNLKILLKLLIRDNCNLSNDITKNIMSYYDYNYNSFWRYNAIINWIIAYHETPSALSFSENKYILNLGKTLLSQQLLLENFVKKLIADRKINKRMHQYIDEIFCEHTNIISLCVFDILIKICWLFTACVQANKTLKQCIIKLLQICEYILRCCVRYNSHGSLKLGNGKAIYDINENKHYETNEIKEILTDMKRVYNTSIYSLLFH